MRTNSNAGTIDIDTTCYLAKNEVTGGHCFAFVITGSSLRDFDNASKEEIRRIAQSMESQPLWQEVDGNHDPSAKRCTDPSDFLNALIRCKDMKGLYQIASDFGPLVGPSESNTSWIYGRPSTTKDGSRLRGTRAWGGNRAPTAGNILLDYVTRADQDSRLRLTSPDVGSLIGELYIDSFYESRSYPSLTKTIANKKSLDNKPSPEPHAEVVFTEPLVDWLLLRNLSQLIGRVMSEFIAEASVKTHMSPSDALERSGMSPVSFTTPNYRRFTTNRREPFDKNFRTGPWLANESKRVIFIRQIAALGRDSVAFLKKPLGRTVENVDWPSGRIRDVLASDAWDALEQISPLLSEICSPVVAATCQDGNPRLSLDLRLEGRFPPFPQSRARLHILFGCQALTRQLSLPLDENGIYLALERPMIPLLQSAPSSARAWAAQMETSLAASGAINAIVHYLRNHIGFNETRMLDAIKEEQLRYGEMRYTPQWLADKALSALIGHEGRHLIVCKNCGRISLAPTKGKPRQFCSQSCQHMHARRSES